jgi:hypothetical protein
LIKPNPLASLKNFTVPSFIELNKNRYKGKR